MHEGLKKIYQRITGPLIYLIVFSLLFLIPCKSFAFSSSKECKECHEEIYNEWKTTSHAKAWINPLFVKITNRREKEKCLPCHAPKPLLETGLDKDPVLRQTNQNEGVDCLSCHKWHNSQAGTIKNAKGFCNPVLREELKDGKICSPCHKKETEEWKNSSAFKEGQTCITCHMEKVFGNFVKGKKIKYGEHKWAGGKNPLFLETVIKNITLTKIKNTIKVQFKPFGVGHNFPTGTSGNPSFHILIRVSTDEGVEVKTFRKNFLRPNDENLIDTTIAPDAEVILTYNLPINKGLLGFICLYKNHSAIKDRDATVIKNILYAFDEK